MIYIFIIALKICNNKIPKKGNVLQKISQETDTKNIFRNFEIRHVTLLTFFRGIYMYIIPERFLQILKLYIF